MQQRIVPNLWFDTEAEEAADFYVSVFPNSRVIGKTHYPEGSPGEPGAVMTVEWELDGLTAAEAYRSESMEAPRGGDGEAPTLAERLGETDDGFADAERRATTESWLAVLEPRERQILHMRFAQDMTQAEIGAVVGVSQMQISRIVRRSLDRIRPLAREDGDRLPEVA